MKRSQQYLLMAVVFLAVSCTAGSQKTPQGIQHVIIIGIDGLSSAGLRKAATPTMDSLVAQGSAVWNARTVLPSVSSPNWASMMHGAGPEAHGITSNEWELDSVRLPPVVQRENGRFPSIFDVVRAQLPDAEIGSVYEWGGFGRLYDKASVNYDAHFDTPDSTAEAFSQYIATRKPVFAFIQLDHVDGAGHHYGHMTKEYLAAITHADSLIAHILEGIAQAGIADQTLLIISSDHGGIGHGHGGEHPEEVTIPILIAGQGVKAGYVVQQPTYTYDIAATAALALGVTQPYAWVGRPIKPAFMGFEEPAY
ncbi:phosphodiesterase [Parapedobacter defluvii]|uniref:Phosphodiesterase n=1 Tax=Parapedobacter defluvii TaxID=2045106 RepID=A0ABQ1LH45_9SPHI|nr:alkaline phosphatase [Parapedobacter defluvii]GGC23765.1 phosphodiesterase [Parapedobacter defluvii]